MTRSFSMAQWSVGKLIGDLWACENLCRRLVTSVKHDTLNYGMMSMYLATLVSFPLEVNDGALS